MVDDGQTDGYRERHTSPFEVELVNRLMVGGRRTSRPMQECLFAAAVFRRDSIFSLLAHLNHTHFQFECGDTGHCTLWESEFTASPL